MKKKQTTKQNKQKKKRATHTKDKRISSPIYRDIFPIERKKSSNMFKSGLQIIIQG